MSQRRSCDILKSILAETESADAGAPGAWPATVGEHDPDACVEENVSSAVLTRHGDGLRV